MISEFIVEESGQKILIESAQSFRSRFLGLMFRKNLDRGFGLLLNPCNSIHMMFMRFAIDVVYLDKNFRIKKLVKNLKPWIGFSMCLKASSTLEIAAGEIDRLGLKAGQSIKKSVK